MPAVSVTERPLEESARSEVVDLAERAEREDGIAPLSEQVLLDVRRPGARRVAHVLLRDGDALLGYAHLDLEAAERPDAPRTGELVVDPAHRRRGFGSVLLTGLRGLTGTAEGVPGQVTPAVSVWAHGDLPAARAFAAAHGLERTRELHVMGIDLDTGGPGGRADGGELPAPPDGVTVATFRPGVDEEAWVRLNAAAFADHPEQGRMSVGDLEDREGEPWFDPERLWLAREADGAGELLASLWLKQQPGEDVAELYVLGVHPGAQGRGLGGWFTRVALADSAARGARRMILYVDGDNEAAVRTYERAGLGIDRTEAQYTG